MESQNDLEIIAQKYFENPCDSNLDLLIKNALKLICSFSRRFGLESLREDLIQAGYEGLLKAIQGFDPKKGVRFTTYASHWIIGKIRHEIRDYRRYECPEFIYKIQDQITEIIDEYFKEKGEIPSPALIAKIINLKEKGVIEAMQAGIISFEQLDFSKIKAQKHESFQLPIEDKIVLFKALNSISTFQKRVIFMLFFQGKTQEETAKILNINQRQVSRTKTRAINLLKEKIGEPV